MFTRQNMMTLQGLLFLAIYTKEKGMRSVSRNTGISVDTINKYISEIEYISGQKIFTHNHNKLILTEYGKYVALLGTKIEEILLEMYRNKTTDNNILSEQPNRVKISFNNSELTIDMISALSIYRQLQTCLNICADNGNLK